MPDIKGPKAWDRQRRALEVLNSRVVPVDKHLTAFRECIPPEPQDIPQTLKRKNE
jgi:hypothetical protein